MSSTNNNDMKKFSLTYLITNTPGNGQVKHQTLTIAMPNETKAIERGNELIKKYANGDAQLTDVKLINL